MKTIKRIAIVTLVLALCTLLFGCGKAKKTLTVHNASEHHLTSLVLSTKEDLSDEEGIFFVYNFNTAMPPQYSEDVVIELPEDVLSGELFVYASLASIDPFKHYEVTKPIGTALSDGAWGFSVDFDSENKAVVVKVLDDSSI